MEWFGVVLIMHCRLIWRQHEIERKTNNKLWSKTRATSINRGRLGPIQKPRNAFKLTLIFYILSLITFHFSLTLNLIWTYATFFDFFQTSCAHLGLKPIAQSKLAHVDTIRTTCFTDNHMASAIIARLFFIYIMW